ncbi:hypothetical protein T12_2565 [Trichinella patagoniensis]|uniref:Uncharacterized protein n=1 Tax=Trichinella patagoniensis TaxID=990121 RepID=A0A0V0Z2M3_9BILA|nr:hypothetical protein T12_2565 [Trichinella patagoniensis]
MHFNYESLLDDLLIRRISFVNNGWRELKETIGQLKILHLPITFGVSEKRLRVQMLDKMRRDTTPGYTSIRSFCSRVTIFISMSDALVHLLSPTVPSNHVRRERKETIEQLKILYLPITFGVSEKRLRVQMLDEMRSDTTPG